jgi:hypothetical protein
MNSKIPNFPKYNVQQYVKWNKQPDGSYIRKRDIKKTENKLTTADIKPNDPRGDPSQTPGTNFYRLKNLRKIGSLKLENQNLNPQNSLLG